MAERDIIQNLIFRLGQSQGERFAAELAATYAPIDGRSSKDLLELTRELAGYVSFYSNDSANAAGNWRSFWDVNADRIDAMAANCETPPHLAMLLSFLKLYEQPQKIINDITGRHLDFYYADVLGFNKRQALPDRAHLVLELKKNSAAIEITPADVFLAGKDGANVELVYAPVATTVIGAAKLDSLRSIYLDSRAHGVVRAAPIANSADGVGGALDADQAKWFGFGHEGLARAEVGFALAAPVLRMKEGTRRIVITLGLAGIDGAAFANIAAQHPFEAFVSGEKTWLGPYSLTAALSSNDRLRLQLEIPPSEKAVVDYDPKVHGYAYATQAPIVLILLKADGQNVGYVDFKNVAIKSAALAVEVDNVSALTLENDSGALDGKKAFLPFGSQPTVGSRFLLGAPEALGKKLSELTLEIQWQDVPPNLSTHYVNYSRKPASNGEFTALVSYGDASGPKAPSSVRLFDSTNATSKQVVRFTAASAATPAPSEAMLIYALNRSDGDWARHAALRRVRQRPVFRPHLEPALETVPGAVTLLLTRDFLHADYRKEFVANVMSFAKSGATTPTLLNEPYTPKVQQLSLSYKAYAEEVRIDSNAIEDFANPDGQFFHVGCFGQMREHGYQRSQLSFVSDPRVPLLPSYEHAGELLVGLAQARAGDSVSMLFQVAEGSADPEVAREDLRWFVLCDNYWKRLTAAEVQSDTTHHLRTSGIVVFNLPAEATSANSILPAGRIWLKAALKNNVAAASQLIQVAANGIEVRVDGGRAAARQGAVLPKGSIAKLKRSVAALQIIHQPYASFGGRALESDRDFHVRAAERLRHKNRCLTSWDYERIILAAFPNVYKVKCIPHARRGAWLSPGHVLVVVVPNLRNANAVNPLAPKVDADTLSRIDELLHRRAGAQTQIAVVNPSYQQVQLDLKVSFQPGHEFNFYSEKLKQELIKLLSPWAFDQGREIVFGGSLHKSLLLDRVEHLDYVDYVTDFKMYSYIGATPRANDLNEVRADAPDAILVSAPSHVVDRVQ